MVKWFLFWLNSGGRGWGKGILDSGLTSHCFPIVIDEKQPYDLGGRQRLTPACPHHACALVSSAIDCRAVFAGPGPRLCSALVALA